jgi:hypothetical protein
MIEEPNAHADRAFALWSTVRNLNDHDRLFHIAHYEIHMTIVCLGSEQGKGNNRVNRNIALQAPGTHMKNTRQFPVSS